MSDQTNATAHPSERTTTLTLPLTRREVIIALYAAAAKARKGRDESSPWTEVQLRDGALD